MREAWIILSRISQLGSSLLSKPVTHAVQQPRCEPGPDRGHKSSQHTVTWVRTDPRTMRRTISQIPKPRNLATSLSSIGTQSREVRHTQVSLVIVTGGSQWTADLVLLTLLPVFILCHTTKWIPNIWELRHTQSEEVSNLDTCRVRS